MVWLSLHSKEYMYFYQYLDTSKMVWKTRHFGARKLIFIIPSIYVWYDLFFFHFALRSVALSQCQWCLECQTRHIVNFLQSLHQGVEITLFSSMFLKETVKQMLVHDSQSQFKNFWFVGVIRPSLFSPSVPVNSPISKQIHVFGAKQESGMNIVLLTFWKKILPITKHSNLMWKQVVNKLQLSFQYVSNIHLLTTMIVKKSVYSVVTFDPCFKPEVWPFKLNLFSITVNSPRNALLGFSWSVHIVGMLSYPRNFPPTICTLIGYIRNTWHLKGVTWDDSQWWFLVQHIVTTLLWHCFE